MPAITHDEVESISLVKALDLTDPVTLVQELEEWAKGVQKQSDFSHMQSLTGGHPNLLYFYQKVQERLLAAAKMLRENVKPKRPGHWDAKGRWIEPEPKPEVPAPTEEKKK